MTDKATVLVLGATGLFGGLLVQRLCREGRFTVVCAGRTRQTLQALRDQTGAEYRQFDRDDPDVVQTVLIGLKPFAVIDCAGPFQEYGKDCYRFARQVVELGCHYLDIADATDFVSEIIDLDELAKDRCVSAISGASSTPAISSAVVDSLTKDLVEVISVESAIIPGNRAKRTLSVMRAVLGQVGQPYEIVRFGKNEQVRGWSEVRKINLRTKGKPLVKGRLASMVNTPDVSLFPERYDAQTVTFRAGLELKIFHHALSFGRVLVATGILKSLAPLSSFARWVASWFESFGSNVGGMKVSVLGKDDRGAMLRREWDLIASDGKGPEIPTLPISILLKKLADGDVKPGARPSPGEVDLKEVEQALSEIDAESTLHEIRVLPIFQQVLGDAFEAMPEAIRSLHNGFGQRKFGGRARTQGSLGVIGWIAAKVVGFPAAATDISVDVTITADEHTENWQRAFGGKTFNSVMSIDEGGFLQESFGPLSMRLGLRFENGKLHYPVIKGQLFGWIPIPTLLLPKSLAHEGVDEEGRFTFDVLLKPPFGGRIAHYKGWLIRRGSSV